MAFIHVVTFITFNWPSLAFREMCPISVKRRVTGEDGPFQRKVSEKQVYIHLTQEQWRHTDGWPGL